MVARSVSSGASEVLMLMCSLNVPAVYRREVPFFRLLAARFEIRVAPRHTVSRELRGTGVYLCLLVAKE